MLAWVHGTHTRSIRTDVSLTCLCSVANVRIPNLQVLNAILYVAEHGCKCEDCQSASQMAHCLYADEPLVQEWGSRPVFEQLGQEGIVEVSLDVLSLDSTTVKVHPDGTGALEKTAHRPWVDRVVG